MSFTGRLTSTALGGLDHEDALAFREHACRPCRARNNFIVDGDGHAFALGEAQLAKQIRELGAGRYRARLVVDEDGHFFSST